MLRTASACMLLIGAASCAALLGIEAGIERETTAPGGAGGEATGGGGGAGASGGAVAAPTVLWSHAFGDDQLDLASGVGIDSESGQIAVVGEFEGNIEFEPDNIDALLTTTPRATWVASFDASGVFQNRQIIPSGTGTEATPAKVDASSNDFSARRVFVAGTYFASMDLSCGDLIHQGNGDIYVIALGADDLGYDWCRGFGTANTERQRDIALIEGNDPAIVGSFQGVAGVTFQTQLAGEADVHNAYVAKLNGDNGDPTQNNATVLNGGEAQAVHVVTNDQRNRVYVSGDYRGLVTIGDDPIDAGTGSDLFVWSLSEGLSYDMTTFSLTAGSGAFQGAPAIANGLAGPIIGGKIRGPVDFGGGAGELGNAGDNLFLAAVNEASPAGFFQGRDFQNVDGGLRLASDGNGLVVAGSFTGTIELGDTFTSAGDDEPDIFVAYFAMPSADESAELVWAMTFGDEMAEVVHDVTLSETQIVVVGEFSGTLEVDDDTYTAEGSASDAFVIAFSRTLP